MQYLDALCQQLEHAMKRTVSIVMSITVLAFLSSCEKEAILSVDQQLLTFTESGGSQILSLTANKPWTVFSDQSWCKVTPTAGEEATSSRISVNCDPNTTYDNRYCTITFTCAELTKTVSVTQDESEGMLISQTDFDISNEAQQVSVEIKANVKFSVAVDEACKGWIRHSATKGLTTSTVILGISKNEDYDGREGRVTISQIDGSLFSTIKIRQSQNNGLFITTSEYELSNESHQLSVEVKSNISFEVTSGASWIKYVETKSLNTSFIVLDIEANQDYAKREGKVIVKQKGGGLEGVITVKQDQNYGLLITQTEYELSNEAQTIDVEIKHNVDFDVVIPADCKGWISKVSTKGLETSTLSFSIAKNDTHDSREGSITFKQKTGALSGTVSIRQAQTDAIIAEHENYSLSCEEQQLSINISSNVEYEVIIDEECTGWINRISTKGLKEESIVFHIAENEGEERRGEITFKGATIQATVLVKQQSGIVVFEDDLFEAYCVTNFDKNKDGKVSFKEALDVEGVDVYCGNMESLKGIEYFIHLKRLRCGWNNLTSLDVSHNTELTYLGCDNNKLTKLDVSNNTALQELACFSNQLTKLDVSKNLLLTHFTCGWNQLTSIDVSHNTALVEFGCDANQLKSIDVSHNTALTSLVCYRNNLTEIDVSHNTALVVFGCDANQLKSLDVSHNTALQELVCFSNELTKLDVSHNSKLTRLECNDNRLARLDVGKNNALKTLKCNNNLLDILDVSDNGALSYLDCTNNPFLTQIWLVKGDSITDFHYDTNVATIYYVDKVITFEDSNFEAYCIRYFDKNGDGKVSLKEARDVESVDVYCGNMNSLKGIEWFINLKRLRCGWNNLTSLDVSHNTELTYLGCDNNKLTSLDVSHNLALQELACFSNQLTSLDVSKNLSLTHFTCGWNQLTSIDVSHNTALVEFGCDANQLKSIDVSHNTALTSLVCYRNNLTEIDVSHNTALVVFGCDANQLKSLDVSHNTALQELVCFSNELTKLDVSHNSKLTKLRCNDNKLSTLDVSNNSLLISLDCTQNPKLLEIWLKNGQIISEFKYDTDIAAIKIKRRLRNQP